jgi:hypothetical protein
VGREKGDFVDKKFINKRITGVRSISTERGKENSVIFANNNINNYDNSANMGKTYENNNYSREGGGKKQAREKLFRNNNVRNDFIEWEDRSSLKNEDTANFNDQSENYNFVRLNSPPPPQISFHMNRRRHAVSASILTMGGTAKKSSL